MKNWIGAVLVLAGGSLGAAERPGAEFLEMGVGARAAGLSQAHTAVARDATALFWNPAGLAGAPRPEAVFSHQSVLADVRHSAAGYVHPLGRGAVGAGVVYLGQGRIEGRGENREATGSFGAADAAATIGAARRLSPRVEAGASAAFLRRTVGGESAQGVAFDLGVAARPGPAWLRTAVAARHLGPGLRFVDRAEALPATITAGAAATTALGLASLDVDWKLVEKKTRVKAGFEWTPTAAFALRAGYASPLAGETGGASSFVWGLGVARGGYAVDYAVVPGEGPEAAQHLTFRVGF